MANTTHSVTLKITDNGDLAAITKDAKLANVELQKMEKSAAASSKALSSIKAASAASKAVSSGAEKGQPTNDMLDYKTTRGITGATGAAGRDFARQSQGLGGLVHVYATFAANVFAVSAAFTALRNAADTTNMIKGLDQLGAASGRNLGGLSKSVVKLTDNAVSLREAMTSVAQASSAGMSSTNIERMAAGAKNVSAALGLNMTDALSRLSRGISKVEPELLDELGIFVRVDKASQDYARSIGKTVSNLTDLEKRTGFANAVLDQMDEKFGKLKIDANPYAQLAASLSNLLQKSLEFINIGLTPIIKTLADNMWLLGAAVAYIGKVLVGMAIPALARFKEIQRETAEKSKELANTKNIAYMSSEYQKQLRAMEHASEALSRKADIAIDSLTKLRGLSTQKKVDISRLNKNDLSSYTAEDIKQLEKYAKEADRASQKLTGAAQQRAVERAAAFRAAAEAIPEYQKQAKEQEALQQRGILSTKSSIELQKAADKANLLSKANSIKATAAATAAEEGFFSAVRKGMKEVSEARKATKEPVKVPVLDASGNLQYDKQKKLITETRDAEVKAMGAMQAAATRVGVLYNAAATSISRVINAFGLWGAAIGLVYGGIQLLDSWMSSNTKQAEKFSAALEGLSSQLESISDVQEALVNKKSSEWLSAESMTTRATAISELSDSTTKLVNELEKVNKASNAWDNFWDRIIGTTRLQKASKAVFENIKEIQKTATPSEAKTKFNSAVRDIVGTSNVSDISQEQLKKLAEAERIFARETSAAAEELAAPKKAFEELNKTFQNLSTSALPSDPLSRFGIELTKVGITLSTLVPGSEAFATELTRISRSSQEMARLGDMGIKLSKVAPELQKQSDAYADQAKFIQNVNTEIEKEIELLKNLQTEASKQEKLRGNTSYNSREEQTSKSRLASLEEAKKRALSAQSEASVAREKILVEFNAVGVQTVIAGLNQFEKSFQITAAQAALKVSSAVAAGMEGEGGINARAEIAKKEIDLRMAGNTIMQELILAQNLSSLTIEKNTKTLELIDLTVKKSSQGSAFSREDETKLASLTKTVKDLNVATTMLSSGGKSFAKNYKANLTNTETSGGAAMLSGVYSSVASLSSQSSQAASEKAALEITRQLNVIEDRYKEIGKDIDRNVEKLEDKKQKTLEVATLTNDMAKAEEAVSLAQKIAAEKNKSILADRAKLEEDLAVRKKANNVSEQNLTKWYNQQKEAIDRKQESQNISNKNSLEAVQLQKIGIKYAIELFDTENRIAELRNSLLSESTNIDFKKTELEYMKQLGAYTDAQYIKAKELLDIDKLRNTIALEQANAQDIFDKKKAAAIKTLQEAQLKAPSDQNAGIANYVSTMRQAGIELSNSKDIIDAKLVSEEKMLKVNSEYSQLLADQRDTMEDMVSMTASLAVAFGDVGTAIGGTVTALTKYAQEQNNIAIARSKLDPVTQQQELIDLNKKAAKQELSGMTAIAAASKKMFSEKAAAYKIINTLEKTTAAYRIALDAKEVASSMWVAMKNISAKVFEITTVQGLESAQTAFRKTEIAKQNAEKAPGIMATLYEQLGIFAPIAIAAVFAALGMSGGSGAASIPAGTSAADRQKVQGTGQSYDASGNIVANGGGYLGDLTKVSTSIKDGIDTLSNVMFENLDFTKSKQYLALKAIEKNTENFVKAVSATTGITGGISAFGTKEGTTKGTFGITSKTYEVLDTGIKVLGTYADIVKRQAVFAQYETVQGTSTRLGKSKSSTWENVTGLPEQAVTYIQQAMQSFGDMIITTAEIFGTTTAEEIQKTLDNFGINLVVSAKGLSNQEFADAVMAQIGIELDKATQTVVPQLKAYYNVYGELAESMTDFVVRLSNTTRNVKLAFESIGSIAPNSLDGILIMTEAAGGLDEFSTKIQSFGDKFLTEAERLAPIQRAVTARMSELGYASVDTREEFKNLITQFQFTDAASYSTFSSLLEVASAFDMVTKTADETSKALNAEELANAKRAMAIEEASLRGFASLAQQMGRDDKIAELDAQDPTGGLSSKQREIYALQDEQTIRKQTIDILYAEGRTQDAINEQRKEEWRTLTDLEKPGKLRLWTLENEAKTQGLSNKLLELQGGAQQLLNEKRARELKALGEGDAAIQQQIYAEEDALATRKLGIEALQAEGKTHQALQEQRKLEWLTLNDLEKAGKLRVWQLQDEKLTQDLNNELLAAQGYAYEALQLSRRREIEALSEADAQIKIATFAAQDAAKTRDLEITLMELSGNMTGALAARREIELRTLSATDQELKKRIWLLEDEQKLLQARDDQEIRIYNLLGNSAAANAISRTKEINAMDESLRPRQRYIYALEDEAELKDKLIASYQNEKNAVQDTIDSTKSMIKTLKDYRDSLLIGDKSPKTPSEIYAEVKQQMQQTAAIALGSATTDAEIAARNDAINKLPEITSSFLDASKTLFASSGQYTSDFNTVLNILDTTSSNLVIQQTTAEKQLSEIETSNTFLESIMGSTETTATLLAKYLAAKGLTEVARGEAAASGSIAASSIPGYASGGVASGMAIVGERGPELVDFATPSRVYSTQASNDLLNNRELVEEIKILRKEVEQLRKEQHKQTGDLIVANYDANVRAADVVAEATERAAKERAWISRIAA